MKLVNMELLANPLNWLIVFMMLAVGYYAFTTVLASGPFSPQSATG